MRSEQWRKDREYLRGLAKTEGTKFIYVLISHMRGKLHMRWDWKKHGGWQHGWAGRVLEYNDTDKWHCKGARIDDLEDQASWIKVHCEKKLFGRHEEIAKRVLSGYKENALVAPAPVAQLAVHVA